MQCVGIRRAEGGIRAAAFHNCFTVGLETDQFRPIFWLSNTDKMEYIDFYSITNSRCYTEYGLVRTGCFGCPFGKAFEEELSAIEEFEPNLLKAANKIFGESYDYTRSYLQFRNEKKRGLS